MKLETFFEKFDQFADAPDAVAKMRELVLELSATGRLIPEALERPVEEDTKLMGTIVELVMGQAPAGDEYNTEGRGTVFVKVGEFGPLYPREEVWTTNPLKFAKRGDVLVCVVGATVGKLNLAIDCAIGRSAAAIRPSAALETKFLYYSLIPYTLRLRRNSRGSAQGVIGKAELNAVSLWVPSREVQKRIVAKVDELMALCDRLEAQQQERETRHAVLARASLARFADAPTPANLNFLFHPSYAIPPADLRKSILTLAVQGKLAPEIKTRHVALGEVIDLISGQHLLAHEQNEAEKGIPYLTGPSDFGERHPKPTRWTETPKVVAEPGDILITVKGSGVGKTNKLISQRTAISRQLMAVRVTGADPDFVHLVLMNAAGHFQESMTGIAIPGIGRKDVLELEAELPPLVEQRRIVAKVAQLMALVDALETQLAASRATAANLLSALVAELTGAPNNGKVSAPSTSSTGRRGRPRKSP